MNSKEGILNYLFGLSETGIKLGLDNVTRLLAEFGDPHLSIPSIHIAGTNGKGSVAAMTESICRSSGIKTGLFTSPHLLDFSERIRVKGKPISLPNLKEIVQRIHNTAQKLNLTPTFFEFTTVIAFIYFAEQKTEINILEVGLGGRLDATNVCQPEIAVITSISKDHTQYLGDDLQQIAFEKASIIKNRGTVLANISDESIFKIIKDMAIEKSATLFRQGSDFQVRILDTNTHEQKIEFEETNYKISSLRLPLLGKHQAENAGLALKICRILSETFPSITTKTCTEGLNSTHWPGRLEVWSQKPLIILDCAHNPSAVKNLTETLGKTFPVKGKRKAIFGVMKDKPVKEMMEILSQWADQLILVKPEVDRSETPEQLKVILGKQNNLEITIIPEIGKAIEAIESIVQDDDIVCITGSLHTVSEAKTYFEKKHKKHMDATDLGIDASLNNRS